MVNKEDKIKFMIMIKSSVMNMILLKKRNNEKI